MCLHLSGSRWLQWQDRWSCNRMKLTLTLSGSLTHSDDWLPLGGQRWLPCLFPLFLILSHFKSYFLSSLHCLINVPTSFLQRALSQRVSFPSSLGLPSSCLAPRWGSAVSAQLDPSKRLLAPRAPVTVACSTLSHLTGHLHSSINCLTPNLHVKSVFMNRFDRNNPAKTVMKRKRPRMSPVWKLHDDIQYDTA